jgi:hypothetical protein
VNVLDIFKVKEPQLSKTRIPLKPSEILELAKEFLLKPGDEPSLDRTPHIVNAVMRAYTKGIITLNEYRGVQNILTYSIRPCDTLENKLYLTNFIPKSIVTETRFAEGFIINVNVLHPLFISLRDDWLDELIEVLEDRGR